MGLKEQSGFAHRMGSFYACGSRGSMAFPGGARRDHHSGDGGACDHRFRSGTRFGAHRGVSVVVGWAMFFFGNFEVSRP